MPLKLNFAEFTGRITHDIKLETLPKFEVVNAQVAIDDSYTKTNDDESRVKVEQTQFTPIRVYRGLAKSLAKYNPKGKLLYFSGKIKVDEYEDKKTKQKRERMYIEVEEWQFVEKKEANASFDVHE